MWFLRALGIALNVKHNGQLAPPRRVQMSEVLVALGLSSASGRIGTKSTSSTGLAYGSQSGTISISTWTSPSIMTGRRSVCFSNAAGRKQTCEGFGNGNVDSRWPSSRVVGIGFGTQPPSSISSPRRLGLGYHECQPPNPNRSRRCERGTRSKGRGRLRIIRILPASARSQAFLRLPSPPSPSGSSSAHALGVRKSLLPGLIKLEHLLGRRTQVLGPLEMA